MTKLRPFKSIGPGDVIKDEMEFYGWSQKDLAGILDISEKHVSQLLDNKISISTNLACLQEFAAGILGQLLLAGFQTTFVFFRLVEAFNCFISTPAHFSLNRARDRARNRYRCLC
ncbi:MAG: helix-turn-helix transcriptional regulator [Candidatus Rifleibacteriota bacterium]